MNPILLRTIKRQPFYISTKTWYPTYSYSGERGDDIFDSMDALLARANKIERNLYTIRISLDFDLLEFFGFVGLRKEVACCTIRRMSDKNLDMLINNKNGFIEFSRRFISGNTPEFNRLLNYAIDQLSGDMLEKFVQCDNIGRIALVRDILDQRG